MRLPNARLRAISPVIALIIVIGVTLAIAFAVVGWLFGLWGGLAGGVPQIMITSVDAYYKNETISGTEQDVIYVRVYMMNKGTADDVILDAYIVHGGKETKCNGTDYSVSVGYSGWLTFQCAKGQKNVVKVGDSFMLKIFFKNSGAMTVSGVVSRQETTS